eukprot:1749056-Karenia_brevis.AAC.1
MAMREFAPRKRLVRALNRLASMWASGSMPDSSRWLLDTSLMWLSKEKRGVEVDDADQEWMIEAQEDEVLAQLDERGLLPGEPSE